jgi:hypothetical protein
MRPDTKSVKKVIINTVQEYGDPKGSAANLFCTGPYYDDERNPKLEVANVAEQQPQQ